MTGASGVKETTRTSNSYRAIGLTIHSIDILRTLMLGMISLLILGDNIDCMKGLRNAIAHNGVLYDCRFKTGETSNRLKEYLAVKMDIHNLDFDRIINYLILLILICSGLSYSKTELQRIIKQFEQNLDFYLKTD